MLPVVQIMWPDVLARSRSLISEAPLGSLRRRWWDLAQGTLGITEPGIVADWWRVLRDHYCEERRFYHNLRHLDSMFAYFDQLTPCLERPDLLALAIFFHDVIYDSRRKGSEHPNNEEQSAEVFREFASSVPGLK